MNQERIKLYHKIKVCFTVYVHIEKMHSYNENRFDLHNLCTIVLLFVPFVLLNQY